ATDVQQPPARPTFDQGGRGQPLNLQQNQGEPAARGAQPQRGQRGQRNAVPPANGQQAQGQQQQQQGNENDRGPKSPRRGLTPLMYAARDGRFNAIKALVDAGADLNARSGDKSTALLIASINGHFDIAKYLVQRGADVNLPSIDDATPLYGVLHVQWSRESE